MFLFSRYVFVINLFSSGLRQIKFAMLSVTFSAGNWRHVRRMSMLSKINDTSGKFQTDGGFRTSRTGKS